MQHVQVCLRGTSSLCRCPRGNLRTCKWYANGMQMVLQLGTNLQTFEFCIACLPKSSDNHTYMRKLLEPYSRMVVTASPALFLISRLDCGALCQPIAQVASTELPKTFRKCLWGTILNYLELVFPSKPHIYLCRRRIHGWTASANLLAPDVLGRISILTWNHQLMNLKQTTSISSFVRIGTIVKRPAAISHCGDKFRVQIASLGFRNVHALIDSIR